MRHSWQDPKREPHLTVRICRNCGLRKLTHHESEGGRAVYWTSFESAEGVGFHGPATPPCVPQAPSPAAADLAEAALSDSPTAARTLTGAASRTGPVPGRDRQARLACPATAMSGSAAGRSWALLPEAA